jgi:hypothetical protein
MRQRHTEGSQTYAATARRRQPNARSNGTHADDGAQYDAPLPQRATSARNRQPPPSQRIRRTPHPFRTEPQDVRVDHGGRHIAVAEKLLDGTDVLASLQEVRGEGVAEGV